MTKSFGIFLTAACAMLLASTSAWAGPRDEEVARVSVYAQALNGQTVYTYSIQNTGTRPIRGFSVGYDHYTGTSELSGEHPLNVVSPPSWESRIIALEESPNFEVRWDSVLGSNGLAPGSSLSNFKVVMPSVNAAMLNGHWTVIFAGPPTYASSRLKVVDAPQGDLIAPSISVELVPNLIWPPSNKLVNVSANVVVSDNQDPAPVVKLVAITCNECDPALDVREADIGTADFRFAVRASRTGRAKPGRVYTVTYSATDSSGNASEASATITVPHDQRKP